MNTLSKLVGVTILIVGILLASAKLVSAHGFYTGTNVDIGQSQPIQETVFAGGNTIDINTEVFGDVFCAGQTVTISGTIHGDVICAGQTVTVNGKVDGNIRLAGQTVNVGA